jgi:hypothetical protein
MMKAQKVICHQEEKLGPEALVKTKKGIEVLLHITNKRVVMTKSNNRYS